MKKSQIEFKNLIQLIKTLMNKRNVSYATVMNPYKDRKPIVIYLKYMSSKKMCIFVARTDCQSSGMPFLNLLNLIAVHQLQSSQDRIRNSRKSLHQSLNSKRAQVKNFISTAR